MTIMKKIFLALMAVAAIAMIGCEGRHYVDDPNEKEPPENNRNHNVFLEDTNGANQANQAPIRMPLSTRE